MVSAQQNQHTLIVNSGPNIGQTYVLHDVVSTFGRSADNVIVLDSTRVSRYHAKITILPTGAVIEDTGSTNGTFVNGQQVTAQYQLTSGDIIGIADYISFQYVVEGSMGMEIGLPPATGRSTQIMDGPGVTSPRIGQPLAPQIGTYPPEFQSNPVFPASPSNFPPTPVMAPQAEKSRPTSLYIIIAVLVVLICFCVALAIFLWFAPEAFWMDLFDFFGLPWPTSSMVLFYC
jgi:predicted component of type VI protein secretion system